MARQEAYNTKAVTSQIAALKIYNPPSKWNTKSISIRPITLDKLQRRPYHGRGKDRAHQISDTSWRKKLAIANLETGPSASRKFLRPIYFFPKKTMTECYFEHEN